MERPLIAAGLVVAALSAACAPEEGAAPASSLQALELEPLARVSAVYKRLAGVPASAGDAAAWAAGLSAAADKQVYLREVVARAATDNDKFYSVTVLNFAGSEASRERSVHHDDAREDGTTLNDLTATIVGMVRDELDYREILFGDVLYVPAGATYAASNNDAYAQLHADVLAGRPLAPSLTATTQSGVTGLSVQAGMFTLRGFGALHYDGGTNRSPVRFASIDYLCRDLEDLSDVSRPDSYVRRDIDRAPGGDPMKFRTECVGCHAGLDPLASAFALFDFQRTVTGGHITIASAPVAKVNRNADVFPGGAIVADDTWRNLWTHGTNGALGWDVSRRSGRGVKSFGEMLAATDMFPTCMAQRVYKTVCLKSGTSMADRRAIAALSVAFSAHHDMKALFEDAAVACALR